MSQREESTWREPYLRTYAAEKSISRAFGQVALFGHRVCLQGFSIIAGGPNYIRTCYRDLEKLSVQEGMLDTIPDAVRSDRPKRSDSLKSYLMEVVRQLAENDPVSGKLVISVRKTSSIDLCWLSICIL